jgi:hypothetical protein
MHITVPWPINEFSGGINRKQAGNWPVTKDRKTAGMIIAAGVPAAEISVELRRPKRSSRLSSCPPTSSFPKMPLDEPKENHSGAGVRKMLHIAQSSRA